MGDDELQAQPEAAAAPAATEGSLLEELISTAKMTPADEGYSKHVTALGAMVRAIAQGPKMDKIETKYVDAMISELDRKLGLQLDEILHHPDVQKLESSWRGLKLMIDRTNFRENIKVELLNVSKSDLQSDFEDSPELVKSGLYKHIYTAEYGTFGGQPVGAIIADYEFDAGPRDMALLGQCASVAAMSHAPFITSAGAKFFGVDDFTKLPNLKDLKSIFEGPQYIKWQSFRESEDARYVGLTAPRFLLRLPYDPEANPVKTFKYEEKVTDAHSKYLWGNTAFTFATKLTDSFAKYRWCPNIIGPQSGGAVEDLPLHQYKETGEIVTKIPTECQISERREFELSEEGFMALTMRKGSDNAAFFSANSAQKPKYFGQSKEGKEAEANYKLGTQLPYMFIINRLAHYIKVLQREQIGSWKERGDLERELNKWIGQYVSDMDVIDSETRGRRPLRQAKITVSDVEGDPGWYKVGMEVRPHFKYMGAFFTLSLVGKLDKK